MCGKLLDFIAIRKPQTLSTDQYLRLNFTLHKGACAKCGARRIDSQLGLESTPEEYLTKMVAVFREVWRVLRDDGTLWVNMGDSYAGGAGGRGDKDREILDVTEDRQTKSRA